MLIRDSNTRNVGKIMVFQMKNQHVVTSHSRARIEDVFELLEEDAGKSAQMLEMELGTNNLLVDNKVIIVETYEKIIGGLKLQRKRIMILGIRPRIDN